MCQRVIVWLTVHRACANDLLGRGWSMVLQFRFCDCASAALQRHVPPLVDVVHRADAQRPVRSRLVVAAFRFCVCGGVNESV